MAGSFDGSVFVSLDSEGFGDSGRTSSSGQTDAKSPPLDTYVENRLDANERYLVQRGGRWTFEYHGDTENVKKYASGKNAGYLTEIPFLVRPSLLRLEFWVYGNIVHQDSNTTGSIVSTAELKIQGRQGFAKTKKKTAKVVSSSVSGPQIIRHTLNLPSVELEESIGIIQHGIEAKNGVVLDSGTIVKQEPFRFEEDPNQADQITPEFAFNTIFNASQDEQTRIVDTNSSSYGILENSNLDSTASPPGGEVVQVDHFEPRTLSIAAWYDDSESVGRYRPQLPAEMRAQEPVLGQDVSDQGENLDGTTAQPIPVATGPIDEQEFSVQGDGDPKRYSDRWRIINTANSDLLIDRHALRLPESNTKDIEIFCLAFLTFSREVSWQGPKKNVDDWHTGPFKKGYSNFLDFARPSFQLGLSELRSGDQSLSDATTLESETFETQRYAVFPESRVDGSVLPTVLERGSTESEKFGMIFDEDFKTPLIQFAKFGTTLKEGVNTIQSPEFPVTVELKWQDWKSPPSWPINNYRTENEFLYVFNTQWYIRQII